MGGAEIFGCAGLACEPQLAVPFGPKQRRAAAPRGADRVETVAAHSKRVAPPAGDLGRHWRRKGAAEHLAQGMGGFGHCGCVIKIFQGTGAPGCVKAQKHRPFGGARQRHPLRPCPRGWPQSFDPIYVLWLSNPIKAQPAFVQQPHLQPVNRGLAAGR